jgi:hypothetical protein
LVRIQTGSLADQKNKQKPALILKTKRFRFKFFRIKDGQLLKAAIAKQCLFL